MMMREMWNQLGSSLAGLMFLWAMLERFFPTAIRVYFGKRFNKLFMRFHPNVQISFHEFCSERLKHNEAYTAIEHYLSSKTTEQARKLKGDVVENNKSVVLSMDENEEVSDEYNGVKVFWVLIKTVSNSQTISFYRASEGKKHYKLTFHKSYREMITNSYLNYVIEEGKAAEARKRQRKLYTNNSGDGSGYKRWSHVAFEHPASFQTLAMDPEKKKEIMDDLVTFSKAKEYYARIGKAWKRGYLLYGPLGTGKSTMIAAIANFLNYDIYDLELTAVKDNTGLRKLLIETSTKSIIVIEDIDCSLDFTGKRKETEKKDDQHEEDKDPMKKKEEEKKDKKKNSQVTLSGLLNFIDGLWSASSGERLIVFTTNYVEKLDSALIRRGRMDKHIGMSYCDFEAFKVLAKNYLDLDSHLLFGRIQTLLEETNTTTADVAENLTPKTIPGDAESCLKNLIQALNVAKEEARVKTDEQAMLNAKMDMKEDAESCATEEAEEEEPSTKQEAGDKGVGS